MVHRKPRTIDRDLRERRASECTESCTWEGGNLTPTTLSLKGPHPPVRPPNYLVKSQPTKQTGYTSMLGRKISPEPTSSPGEAHA